MMRRFMLALMMLLTTVCESYALSEDVYLRKDVFDAKMDAFMSEIRGEFREIRGEIQVLNTKIDALSRRVDDNYNSLSKRIDDVGKRVDDVRSDMYLLFVGIGIIVSLPFIVKAFQALEERKRQTVTLEDVKRLIAESKLAS